MLIIFISFHTESNFPKKLFTFSPMENTSLAIHLKNVCKIIMNSNLIRIVCFVLNFFFNYFWSPKPCNLRHRNRLLIFFSIFCWMSCHNAPQLNSLLMRSIVSTTHCTFPTRALPGSAPFDKPRTAKNATQTITHFMVSKRN